MPWRLLENYGPYIFGWLVGYSGFLGPIAGIFIADYWVVRRGPAVAARPLRQPTASTAGGTARRSSALAAGVALALVGLVVPALRSLYDYAWFVGFAVAFASYC